MRRKQMVAMVYGISYRLLLLNAARILLLMMLPAVDNLLPAMVAAHRRQDADMPETPLPAPVPRFMKRSVVPVPPTLAAGGIGLGIPQGW
jgi:hypothetical protein